MAELRVARAPDTASDTASHHSYHSTGAGTEVCPAGRTIRLGTIVSQKSEKRCFVLLMAEVKRTKVEVTH